MSMVRHAPGGERLTAEERREVLLDAAKRLVLDDGPAEVTMGAVADTAGVARALVYKHFDNKDDLLVELYRREAAVLDEAMQQVVLEAESGFEAKLRALVGVFLDAADEHGAFFRLLRTSASHVSVREDQRGWDRRTVRYYASLAIHDFGIDRDTAVTAVAILLQGLYPLRSQYLARPDADARARLEQTYVELSLGALGALRSDG